MLVSGVQHILCRSTVGNLWLNCLCCPCVVVIINLHFHCTFMDLFIIDYTQISETVIEDRFCLEHGTKGWYDALDHHFRWLLQYRISPFFCRWGDSMRILAYTCPWPGNTSIFVGKTICCYGVWFFSHLFIIIIADHPKAKEYYSDPRLAAYAVPYAPILSRYCSNFCQVLYQFAIYVFGSFFFIHNSTDAAKNSLRREVEILKSEAHWSKSYFYLWDEVCHCSVTRLYNTKCKFLLSCSVLYDAISICRFHYGLPS